MSDIATLQNQILAAIDAADTPDALEAVRIDALGKPIRLEMLGQALWHCVDQPARR